MVVCVLESVGNFRYFLAIIYYMSACTWSAIKAGEAFSHIKSGFGVDSRDSKVGA